METTDIKIALCGNPKGQEYAIEGGFEENMQRHIEGLYRDWDKRTCDFFFVKIETNANSEVFFYYTYIRPNTKECGQLGRYGGNCAVILRVRQHYCEDMVRLYQLFKKLFSKFVEGKFIKGERFIVEKFDEAKSQDVFNALRNQIEQSFKSSFTPLEEKIVLNNGILQRNISEYGCELYLNELFKAGSAILSEEIPNAATGIENSYKKQLSEQAAKFKEKLDLAKKQNVSDEQQIAKLTRINKEQAAKVEEFNTKHSDLRKRAQEIKADGELKEWVKELRDKVINQTSDNKPSKKRDLTRIGIGFNCILSILIFILVGVNKCDDNNAATTETSTETITEFVEPKVPEQPSKFITIDANLFQDKKEIQSTDTLIQGTNVKFFFDGGYVKTWRADGFQLPPEEERSEAQSIIGTVIRGKTEAVVTVVTTDDKEYKTKYTVR